MIPLSRRTLIVLLGLIAVAAIGLVFGHLTPAFGDLTLALWLVLLIEVVVYFLGAVVSNPEIHAARALLLAVLLCLTRLVVSAVAGLLIAFLSEETLGDATLRAWVGNPAGVFLQVFLLMLMAPHVVQMLAPGLLSPQIIAVMEGGTVPRPPPPMGRQDLTRGAEPVGGFIQVFSLQELQSIFRKSVGMEGYIIYTSEGLVLWKDFPIRLDVEALAAQAAASTEATAATMEGFGLSRVRRVVVEAREHNIFQTRLNPNFGLIMLFSSSVRIEDCWSRMSILARTTQEYLHWKYPDLGAFRPSPAAEAAPAET